MHWIAEMARRLRDLPAKWQFRDELRGRQFIAPSGTPVLAFGAASPDVHGLIHGGRVKLIQLTRSFAHSERCFNILYLVSSAIPAHAEELVRWARSCGAQFVWNQNGVGFPAWAGSSTGGVNRPMRRLRAEADFVIYQSRFCREASERYLGPAAAPQAVLLNPVDLAAFSPSPTPPSTEEWRLLAAGTHNQAFRVLGAIETVRLLRRQGLPARLVIAGALRWRGAELAVRRAIDDAALGDHVEVRPPFTQPEAVQMLRASHVLLHLKYQDACPTIVMEAMACGVPVVASRSGGMEELLGRAGGELCDIPVSWERAAYPSSSAVAASVVELMREWPLRSQAARRRAERHFSADRWVQAHREIFQQLTVAL